MDIDPVISTALVQPPTTIITPAYLVGWSSPALSSLETRAQPLPHTSRIVWCELQPLPFNNRHACRLTPGKLANLLVQACKGDPKAAEFTGSYIGEHESTQLPRLKTPSLLLSKGSKKRCARAATLLEISCLVTRFA